MEEGATLGHDAENQRLVLDYSGVTLQPTEIIALGRNLRELHLDGNHISDIPDSLSELTNLIRLSMYDNNLTTLPASLSGLTNLKAISVGKNQLAAVPDTIFLLTGLQSLNL